MAVKSKVDSEPKKKSIPVTYDSLTKKLSQSGENMESFIKTLDIDFHEIVDPR